METKTDEIYGFKLCSCLEEEMGPMGLLLLFLWPYKNNHSDLSLGRIGIELKKINLKII